MSILLNGWRDTFQAVRTKIIYLCLQKELHFTRVQWSNFLCTLRVKSLTGREMGQGIQYNGESCVKIVPHHASIKPIMPLTFILTYTHWTLQKALTAASLPMITHNLGSFLQNENKFWFVL